MGWVPVPRLGLTLLVVNVGNEGTSVGMYVVLNGMERLKQIMASRARPAAITNRTNSVENSDGCETTLRYQSGRTGWRSAKIKKNFIRKRLDEKMRSLLDSNRYHPKARRRSEITHSMNVALYTNEPRKWKLVEGAYIP